MKLLEMTLSTVDLEQMRQFYAGFLGLREVEPHWTGRLVIQAGGTRINFIPASEHWRGYYHFALDVPPDRFIQAGRWLRERAIPIASPEGETVFHHDVFNADAVYFRDPAGNIVELIARYDLLSQDEADGPNTGSSEEDKIRMAERPFNASEIIAVSEIGLAVDSVVDSVAQILERMPGVEIYTGEGSDQFTSVGDVRGLLIVVRRGRIWFPNTGIPAAYLPLSVLIEVEKGSLLQQRYLLQSPPNPFTITPAP